MYLDHADFVPGVGVILPQEVKTASLPVAGLATVKFQCQGIPGSTKYVTDITCDLLDEPESIPPASAFVITTASGLRFLLGTEADNPPVAKVSLNTSAKASGSACWSMAISHTDICPMWHILTRYC